MARKMTWRQHVEAVQEGRPGLPVIEVVWEDALSSAVTEWAEEPGTVLMPTLTVGYLAHEDRRSITLVSLVNTDTIGHALTIPKSCVVSRRTLT